MKSTSEKSLAKPARMFRRVLLSFLSLGICVGAWADAQVIIPGPTFVVLGGISDNNGQVHSGLFTWLSQMEIYGTEFTPGVAYQIVLHGPLGLTGVAPTDRLAPPSLFADANGTLRGLVTIPYANNQTGYLGTNIPSIPRPGRYEVLAIGPSGTRIAKNRINLAPDTIGKFVFGQTLNWPRSRGARDGLLADKAPERTDPEYTSVWSEEPVQIYATVAAMDLDANNQPTLVSHHEWPAAHYAHDFNLLLVPDEDYRWVLGTSNLNGTLGHHATGRLELEWEVQNNGYPTGYGLGNIGLPTWAMATVGDRVFTVGRWILDNGHPPARTEIHPPRLLATMRKRNSTVLFNTPDCATCAQQVDIYVSGNGGAANKFYDGLSAALNNSGLGGARIEDVMDKEGLATYYRDGPADPDLLALVYELYNCASCGVITDAGPIAGPSGMADGIAGYPVHRNSASALTPWTQGPIERTINEMDYDFDVLLPSPPAGATSPRLNITTHPEHTTSVIEQITYIDPDPATGLPTKAHIRLPYHGADNGIYARTLKFYWDAPAWPGRHFVVKLNEMDFFFQPAHDDDAVTGREFMWADVSGQWLHVTPLDPAAFLHATDALIARFPDNSARFDVYLRPEDILRFFTVGYDTHDMESLYSVDVGKPAYLAGHNVALTWAEGNGDNVRLGGSLFEAPPIPTVQAAGGILGRHFVYGGICAETDKLFNESYCVSYFTDLNISYVHDPRIQVLGGPADFGKVSIGSSADRVIRIANAVPGINNNDPYANAGIDTLNFNFAVSGAGFTLAPPSAPTSLSASAGQGVDITLRYTATDFTASTGTLTINSNDKCRPSLAVPLCAEGVPTGFRVLVLQGDGTPYPMVDQITLTGNGMPQTTKNLTKVPLTVLNPPASCQRRQYHYQAELPPNISTKPPGSYYDLRVRVGTKAQMVRFTLEPGNFQEITITLQ